MADGAVDDANGKWPTRDANPLTLLSRRLAPLLLLLVALGLGAEAAKPKAEPPLAHPLADGPLPWTTSDYDLGVATVGGPDAAHSGYEYQVRLTGTLTLPEGPGPFPLVAFLHGHHSPCANPDGSESPATLDCSRPYRNDRGYLYLMEFLAGHGIASASASANDISLLGGDPDLGMWARGEMVLATVDALAAGADGPRLDLSRVGLVGHSRGGEGVVTAVEANAARAAPLSLAAVVALAPTDFAARRAAGVPFLSVVPYCDGDVYALHGLRTFDASRFSDAVAVKSQVLVMGANHNNYNTMWGSDAGGGAPTVGLHGDDAGVGRHQSTHCDLPASLGGGRLTPEQTYAEARLHVGGFLRWTLLGEAGLAPYFLGAPPPAAACPGGAQACLASTLLPGRRDLFHAEASGLVPAPGVAVSPAPAVCQRDGCASNVYSSAWMADLPVGPGGAELRVAFDGPADLRATPLLQVRVAVPTDRSVNAFGPPHMAVTFRDDAKARTVVVDDPALSVPPGLVADPGVGALEFEYVGGAKVSANAVLVPIPPGIDRGRVTAIELRFTGAEGLPDRILVADAWLNPESAAAYST